VQARAAIAGIDATAALELPGVEAFISAKDLPKHRNLISYTMLRAPVEPIFAGERVEYYGQPLGLVVATSQASEKQDACPHPCTLSACPRFPAAMHCVPKLLCTVAPPACQPARPFAWRPAYPVHLQAPAKPDLCMCLTPE